MRVFLDGEKRRTMYMKKKLLSVLLAGVMVVSLAACGGGDSGSGSDSGRGRGREAEAEADLW